MGLVLPGALTWILDMIGIEWPNIDEDELKSAASELRDLASELTGNTGDAQSQIEQMLSSNSSQSLELFEGLWKKLADGHLPQLSEGLKALGDGLDVAAGVVIAMKAAAIVQLAILAAEVISDQVEAFFTFGASEALIPIQVAATRLIVKKLFDQAVKAVEQQLLNALEGPVFNALGGAGEELAGQLLGDALGTNSGVDLGKVGAAAGSGFEQGVQSVTGGLVGGGSGGSTDTSGGGYGGGATSDQAMPEPAATPASMSAPLDPTQVGGGTAPTGQTPAQPRIGTVEMPREPVAPLQPTDVARSPIDMSSSTA